MFPALVKNLFYSTTYAHDIFVEKFSKASNLVKLLKFVQFWMILTKLVVLMCKYEHSVSRNTASDVIFL